MILFCHITSKVKGAAYPNLLHERGGAGWPYACFMNAEGQLVARQPNGPMHRDGVEAFEATLAGDVREYLKLREAAKKGGKEARAAFFMKQFELDALDVVALREAIADQTFLDKSQRTEVGERLVEFRVRDLLAGVDMEKPESFGPTAKKLLALQREDGLPAGPAGINPWYVILEDAWLRRDAKTFEVAFTALKAAGLGSRTRFVASRQKQLDQLRAQAKKKK